MSYLDDFANELKQKIAACWPDTDTNRMMGKASALVNWREAISAGEANTSGFQLHFPLAVAEVGPFTAIPEFGDGHDSYKSLVTLIYIRNWNNPVAGENRITAAEMDKILLNKADAARLEFAAEAEYFSVIDQVTWNQSIMSQTNQYLVKNGFNGIALEVYVDVVVVVADS